MDSGQKTAKLSHTTTLVPFTGQDLKDSLKSPTSPATIARILTSVCAASEFSLAVRSDFSVQPDKATAESPTAAKARAVARPV